jgi:tRNA(His) guanylyltransferase
MQVESLESRMKDNYEHSYRIKLPRRMPVIIRLDGKAFHTFTRRFKKPFDEDLMDMMNNTAKYLCRNVQGCQLAYVQSDEISLLLHNYKKLNSESWFDNNIQKIVSISAGMASSYFTMDYITFMILKNEEEKDKHLVLNDPIVFDSRVFILPESEVNNYFVWRQQDATRNSIEMVAQSIYSSKELHKVNCNQLQEMIFKKSGKNWNDYPVEQKRGRCIKKVETVLPDKICNNWQIDKNLPIFSKQPDYINDLLKVEEF